MINYETIVQPQEFTVEQIFNNNEYLIPIYQRNYAWSSVEIEQLLDDINDIDINKTKKYYLGNLIVNERGINCFEVIDGQQRLTTLFLLLCFLNNQSINEGSLTFEAREVSNRTLNLIKARKARNDKSGYSENLYSQEIIEGYSIISKYFDKKNRESISEFNKKLSAIILVRTQVPKNIDLNHYFEIMNTRGEQLELHEIMKAKILGAIKSSGTEFDKIDKIIASTIWDACSQMNKYVQMCFPIEKRNFIFSKSWNSFDINEFAELRKWFCEDKLDNEVEFTLESILRQPIEKLNTSINENSIENDRFESIVTFPNFLLLVNEAMSISDTNMKVGWTEEEGLWYYYDKGKRRTGWLKSGSKWFYLNPDKDGAMVTGWLEYNHNKFYFNSKGYCMTGKQVIDGNTYEFNKDGYLIK